MSKKIIIAILLLATLSTISFPVFNYFVITPAFTSYIIVQAEKRLTEIAYNISSSVDIQDTIRDHSIIEQPVIDKIVETKSLFGLDKIKVFSENGKVVYSTDSEDIGTQSKQDFFRDIMKRNEAYSVLGTNDGESAGKGAAEKTIVESYVPIAGKSKAVGVFEIYYDITDTKEQFGYIVSRINLVVLILSTLLLLSVFVSAVYALKSFIVQRRTEREKDELIEHLTAANKEIQTLRGIIPLCSRCKKIRDDKGYWEQVDVYLYKHADLNFTHGFCPECYEKEIVKIEDFRKKRGITH